MTEAADNPARTRPAAVERPQAAEVAAIRDALITTITGEPAAEQRVYRRLLRGDNPDQ